MTTQYRLARDVTGAFGNVLTISNDFKQIEVFDDIAPSFLFSGEHQSYIVEFNYYPTEVNGDAVLRVDYYENLNVVTGSFILNNPKQPIYKVVKGGSAILISKAREDIDSDCIVLINMYKEQ